ncbi:hypothetical protein GCM10011412_19630 [Maribacter cobaltidurans]|nr:hypothetical protein GCM10011412_19630 [Maribacter cobaltidurans]
MEPEKDDELAPTPFNLLEIPNNTIEVELMPSFSWQIATDPDGEKIRYDFILDTKALPTEILKSNLSEANFTVTSSLELNTKYYWKVIAKDESMNTTESEVFNFTTIEALPNEAPENFNLLTVEDNSLDVPLKPSFTWEVANDPENDVVSYDFYLGTEAETITKIASDLDQPSFTMSSDLSYNTTYYWTVVAKDDKDNFTETEIYSFITELMPSGVDVPFAIVDEPPIYPGCEDSNDKKECFTQKIVALIDDNLVYPSSALENGIEGRVNCVFTISTTGAVTNIRVRGPDQSLENEAIRILNLLPNMIPGKQNGEVVNVPYGIPITFKLE